MPQPGAGVWTGVWTRRGFVAAVASLVAAPAAAWAGPAAAQPGTPKAPRRPFRHPEPRPGVTAGRIVPDEKLADDADADARAAFREARRIPAILDGLRCRCPCSEDANYRSLLVCYEMNGMAQHCGMCQAQARMAYRLARRGRTLAQIRRALDARFG